MPIIREDDDCPIKPENIVADAQSFMGSVWKNMETEVTAYWLVMFAQRRQSWAPFTMEQLEAFYHEKRPEHERFYFNKLRHNRYDGDDVIIEDGEYLHFTTEFVAACYAISPA